MRLLFQYRQKPFAQTKEDTVRYLLLHTDGKAFARLAKYIQYHSLSDLLIEIMQVNVFCPAPKDQDETVSTVDSSQDKSVFDDDDQNESR